MEDTEGANTVTLERVYSEYMVVHGMSNHLQDEARGSKPGCRGYGATSHAKKSKCAVISSTVS